MRVLASLAVFLGALCLLTGAALADQASPTEPVVEAAELKVANRSVVVLRNTLLGETPQLRVRRAEVVIQEVLQGTEELLVSIEPIQTSYLVLLGGERAFIVSPKDLEPGDDSVLRAAERAAENLRLVVSETREARNLRFLLVAGGLSGAATLFYYVLVQFVFFIRRKLIGVLPRLMHRHSSRLKVGSTHLLDTPNLYPFLARLLGLLCWLVVLLLTYGWLSFVLRRFPYTRPWGESLNSHLIELATYILDAVVRAIPGLVIALCIFLIARGVSAFSKSLVERLATSGSIAWLSQETLQPTTRLTSLAIWLFALAMAYPYLPGADTAAFKGLSVLIGLMISLGASSVVGQAAAGLILTYTRTLRVGEFVRIGEHEGTVTELGMFTTTIRTGHGEMLTIPNTMITGAVTCNYSRTVQGPGYIVDTTVTIGYDTPWRQVEAMLLEAAHRTPGIVQTPEPVVFQTALTDFYPEYRLVAHAVPEEPRPRAELLTSLHASIQDVFNEYGVQIMSPHYLGDPDQAKWVPPEQWFTSPARPNAHKERSDD